MGRIVNHVTNPWGRAMGQLEPQRQDLWRVDLRLALTTMATILRDSPLATLSNSLAVGWVLDALPAPDTLSYMARSVQFPSRQVDRQAVKRDNGTSLYPGYNANPGTLTISFLHDAPVGLDRSQLWAALTLWRAFVRAGQGFDFPGTPELTLGLSGAARPGSLIPAYRHDLSIELLRGADLSAGANADLDDPPMQVASTYRVMGAWLTDIKLNDLGYSSGNQLLEVVAGFQIDDYTQAPAGVSGPPVSGGRRLGGAVA